MGKQGSNHDNDPQNEQPVVSENDKVVKDEVAEEIKEPKAIDNVIYKKLKNKNRPKF